MREARLNISGYMVKFVYMLNFGFWLSIVIVRIVSLINRKKFEIVLNDKLLEFMVRVMKLFFDCSPTFRENFKGFRGIYVLKTNDNSVVTKITFNENEMIVEDDNKNNDYKVMIVFKDTKVMRKCLKNIVLKGNIDFLNSILNHEIETDGNLNYAFKFLFLISNITHRVGIK